MGDARTLFVPDGLDGERVDAAIARLFGFSRTRAAELAADGMVTLNERVSPKSARVSAGDVLEVVIPDAPSAGVELVAEPVPGMSIVHDDDDLVVVDKPVGVAAHPSVGWTGPVSYTHLDVYKRQAEESPAVRSPRSPFNQS